MLLFSCFFFIVDLDLGAHFFHSRYESKNLNSPNLILDLGDILSQSKSRSLINIFLGIQYPCALSLYTSSASNFNGNDRSYGVLLNHEDLLFQMLDLCLFNLFWLFPHDDGIEEAESGKAVVTEDGISGACSTTDYFAYCLYGTSVCLIPPVLVNRPYFLDLTLFCTILGFALLRFALL